MSRAILALVFFFPALALAAGDPIQAELAKARSAYGQELDAAKTKLVASLEAKLQEFAGKGDLDKAKAVKSQKESFEKGGTLPTGAALANVKADYESDLLAAKVNLRKALEKAKESYTKAVKLDEAEALAKELKELADTPPAKKGADAAAKAEPKVVATWAHQVGVGKNALKRDTFKLYSNGKINDPDGRDTWAIKGGLMILTWQNTDAPGGAWKDVVNLAIDGKSYSGKNNKGVPILGVKLAAGDVDAEKKK